MHLLIFLSGGVHSREAVFVGFLRVDGRVGNGDVRAERVYRNSIPFYPSDSLNSLPSFRMKANGDRKNS
jgi:hypothetical protein